jgi:uncharacterized membrane protein YqjE
MIGPPVVAPALEPPVSHGIKNRERTDHVTVQSQQPTRSTATSTAAASTEPSIGQLAADASTQLSTIIRGEVELAKLELTASVKKAGIGAAMFAAAGVILAYSLTFGLISLAEGIHSLGLWRWLSYLIVFAALVIIALILVFVGIRMVKKVKSPERTIATTKDTVAYLKHPTKA